MQTKASPPIPALRLLLVVSLLAFGTLLALDALSLAAALARHLWQTSCSPRQRRRQPAAAAAAAAAVGPDVEAGGVGASPAGSKAGSEGKDEQVPVEERLRAVTSSSQAEVDGPAEFNRAAASAGGATSAEGADEAVQRPDVLLKRGLSRRLAGFEARHPRPVWVAAQPLPVWIPAHLLPDWIAARPLPAAGPWWLACLLAAGQHAHACT